MAASLTRPVRTAIGMARGSSRWVGAVASRKPQNKVVMRAPDYTHATCCKDLPISSSRILQPSGAGQKLLLDGKKRLWLQY